MAPISSTGCSPSIWRGPSRRGWSRRSKSRPATERFPITWTHGIDKESLKIKWWSRFRTDRGRPLRRDRRPGDKCRGRHRLPTPFA
ncbi:hypothetical protein D1O30_00540 [Methylocystis hirsuta]|uniref:Uncharacterized protein n=1 Tax=Methylocystis hirsuta TaxID=369798 RepID=A0A3M9XKY8_9HYPH|nr:hypothetical protein D1O30_00540 [Methylocystis hirsuta]